ncbi:LysR family transcriptional regulator [Humitalea rosea]|uniref:LysR family transcriptional regulator n=1 Tax=Humitalea rosea TaxID=990373 RepID=A0A2W7INT9_9PROT|nr:LysR family transcriptional regulator [Humitalea rosea]PZW49179.1 LysR family transcriptional regulator [Humitalea rosea]
MIDALTLDQLRIFLAVADSGSFTGAGKQLQRVQSAISQSIQTLEVTLGLALFDRREKKPRLTHAGRALVADARRVIAGADMLRGRAESISKGLEAELAIAIGQLLPQDIGMAVLRELQQRFPELPVRLLTGGIAAPERYLRAGTVELAIFPLELTQATDLEAEFLLEVPLVPVVASSHPLATLPGLITRQEISSHVQLVLTDAMTTDDWSRGVVSSVVWRFADMNARMVFLLNGFGWCNMPLHMVAPHLKSGALTRLRLTEQEGFTMQLHAVYQRGRPPGPAGRWVIDRLHAHLAARGN